MIEAFPWDEPPRYLLRDRDKTHREAFRKQVGNMGFEEGLIALMSP